MLHFPKWKILLVVAVCLAGFIIALPNFLTKEQRLHIPSWLPSQTVNLGLDLQGGSYLLLEVNVDSYLKEQVATLEDDVRQALRKGGIGYQSLAYTSEHVSFALRDVSQESRAVSALKEMSHDINVSTSNGVVSVTFTPVYIAGLRKTIVDQSIEIVRRRVDETGTREPIIQRQGATRILLQVPGLSNPNHLKQLLGKTAKMTFHLLDNNASVADALRGRVPPGSQLVKTEEGNQHEPYIVIKKKIELSGDMLLDARAGVNNVEAVVNFRFNTMGAKKFGDITKAHVGERFAIVLDNVAISAPVIREPILGGSGQISGSFTVQSANDLALLLRAGALPAPLDIIEERSVGPSLGTDSIAAGKLAAFIGTGLVMVFMLLVYRLFGLFANVALVVNLVLLLAALSLFQATLTLPGIAGIVLTIGMAVDSNVLIYERIREEIRLGRSPFSAIDQGFREAFTTIFDSNITTLITAFILFYFGSGPVKGFGVTLSIGIIASMFSAIMFTRLLVVVWLKRVRPKVLKI